MPSARQSVVFDVGPAQAMATLTDFEAYPTFLPELQRVQILHQEVDAWEVQFTLQMIRPLVYTLRLTQPNPLSLDWSLIEGVFRSNYGGWTLEALDDGARTRAHYAIDVQIGMFVPGNIIHSLVDAGLPRTLDRFREEIHRRKR